MSLLSLVILFCSLLESVNYLIVLSLFHFSLLLFFLDLLGHEGYFLEKHCLLFTLFMATQVCSDANIVCVTVVYDRWSRVIGLYDVQLLLRRCTTDANHDIVSLLLRMIYLFLHNWRDSFGSGISLRKHEILWQTLHIWRLIWLLLSMISTYWDNLLRATILCRTCQPWTIVILESFLLLNGMISAHATDNLLIIDSLLLDNTWTLGDDLTTWYLLRCLEHTAVFQMHLGIEIGAC